MFDFVNISLFIVCVCVCFKVLVDIPNKHLHVLNEIIKLVDPEMQPLVADVLHIVPKEILLDMIRFKPDSEIRIIECINKVNGDTRRVRYASWMKRQVPNIYLNKEV